MACECSEDFGPCEQHADVLVVREGASLHSADELLLLLVEDLVSCGAKLTEHDQAEFDRLSEDLHADPHSGVESFGDPDNFDAAVELSDRVTSYVEGLWVFREDGYNIFRPHPDCPLLEAR